MLSPIHQTPAPHQSRHHHEKPPPFVTADTRPSDTQRNSSLSSTSDSGSDTNETDSESSSEDSAPEEKVDTSQAERTSPSQKTLEEKPVNVAPAVHNSPPHRNEEQEGKMRWNLASFVNSQTDLTQMSPKKQTMVQSTSPDSRKRAPGYSSESEHSSDSIAVKEAQRLAALGNLQLVSSLSDSEDQQEKRPTVQEKTAVRRKQKRQRRVGGRRSSSDSDSSSSSEGEKSPVVRTSPSKAPKPMVRPSPRTKSIDSSSDSSPSDAQTAMRTSEPPRQVFYATIRNI